MTSHPQGPFVVIDSDEDDVMDQSDHGRGNDNTYGLLHELSKSIQQQLLDIAFACGGDVPVAATHQVTNSLGNSRATVYSDPVTIRWDAPQGASDGSQGKITFPLGTSDTRNLVKLLRDMQPATFGLRGQDVLDETYRKASKMDTTQFCTTFNPYELGIIDVIAQALLPTIDTVKDGNKRAVRAELYKLNVYSGPSGRFKAHVDTPRSPDQFGSLVVCLPLAHEGGELQVRHRVRSGYRVTLTYNLYATRGNGLLARQSPILDPTQLPFHGIMRETLLQPGLMTSGGYIGVHTTHAYPHTSKLACLPDSLKGLDMVLWQGFQSLGCRVTLRPVVEASKLDMYSDEDDGYDESNSSVENDSFERNHDKVERYIGRELGLAVINRETRDWDDRKRMLVHWSSGPDNIDASDVVWLNTAGLREVQISYMAYGNQAETAVIYANCAIIAEILPCALRLGPLGNAAEPVQAR
ncbi:putative 2og-fe oxygenase family protein [Seiridium cardinale]|uniref:2og-fe oxygenase family protein n=1 Tax=Seiridium cardinale TaxID=138064 RepID=A0ABR2XL89_9PEZI